MHEAFVVHASLVERGTRLRWKPVRRAKSYAIEWLGKDRQWAVLWDMEGDEITPNGEGFVEYEDKGVGHVAGGTYRVTARFSASWSGKSLTSPPVSAKAATPKGSTRQDLARRLARRRPRMSKAVKALVMRLKLGPYGWTMLLPEDAGRCLGQRIEVEVHAPELTDATIGLLETIFERLPRITARVERAFEEYGGHASLDEDERMARPCLAIGGPLHEGKPPGAWTMVLAVKGSDYAWHVEFVRSRFREIWAGD